MCGTVPSASAWIGLTPAADCELGDRETIYVVPYVVPLVYTVFLMSLIEWNKRKEKTDQNLYTSSYLDYLKVIKSH